MSELKKAQEALEKKAKSYDARKARWIQTSQESEPHKESLNLVRGIHWHMTAIRGKSYEPGRSLMVVGQASRGCYWDPPDGSPAKYDIADEWAPLKEYPQTVREISLGLGVGNESGWGCDIVASNLYKASDTDEIPTEKFCEFLFDDCMKVLIEEVKEFRPRRLLFLTRYWFDAFRNHKNSPYTAYTKRKMEYPSLRGQWRPEWGHWHFEGGKAKVVVAPHPGGMRWGGGGREQHVEAIINAFKELPE